MFKNIPQPLIDFKLKYKMLEKLIDFSRTNYV